MKTEDVIKKYIEDPLNANGLTAARAKVRAGVLYIREPQWHGGYHPWRLSSFVWRKKLLVSNRFNSLGGGYPSLPLLKVNLSAKGAYDLPPRCRGNDPTLVVNPALKEMKEKFRSIGDGSNDAQIMWEVLITHLACKIVENRNKCMAEIERLKKAAHSRLAVLDSIKPTFTGDISQSDMDKWLSLSRNANLCSYADWKISGAYMLPLVTKLDMKTDNIPSLERSLRSAFAYNSNMFQLHREEDLEVVYEFLVGLGLDIPPVFGKTWDALDLTFQATMRPVAINTMLNPHILDEENKPENKPESKGIPSLF